MKKVIIVAALLVSGVTSAMDFQAYLWSKDARCEMTSCLPQVLTEAKQLMLSEPQMDSISKTLFVEGDYKVVFRWMKKSGFGGYFSFQTEIFSGDKLIALCSRYEALDTMENVPVGACSGLMENGESLLGVTVAR